MSTVTQAHVKGPAQPIGGRWWQVLRWGGLALFVVAMSLLLNVGERQEPYARLQAGLADGSIAHVRVEGAMGGAGDLGGAQGVTTVRLSWRDDWHEAFTEVVQASSQSELERQSGDDESLPRIIGPIDTELHTYSTDVDLTWAQPLSGVTITLGGWSVRGDLALLPLAMLGLLPFVLATGPEPRLATRWAWFWLIISPLMPIAVAAFLFYGRRLHQPERTRLTGWWAFLIMLVTPAGFLAG